MIPLLAQFVAPPLQPGPVRLPGQDGLRQERPASRDGVLVPPRELQPSVEPPAGAPPLRPRFPLVGEPVKTVPISGLPEVRGLTVYSPEIVRRTLAPCASVSDPAERLRSCAAALTARLVADGYINSRVYVKSTPLPGRLEVVEGNVAEVRVNGGDPRLNRRVQRLLRPLQGQALNLPRVERDLQLLRRQPGVNRVQGRLSRLGSDPSQASLAVNLPPGRPPWQGQFALRNDGNDGSGEGRAVATLLKPSLAVDGDSLLLYGELNASDAPDLGTVIGSLSYTIPLADTLSLTGAFGYTRRNLVELSDPLDGFSTSQYQGLVQLEWVFHETLRQRWSLFAGYSGNRSNNYLDDAVLPEVLPESVRKPSNGYLRLGVNGSGVSDRAGWSGTAFLLQGIAAATPATQRQELDAVGIEPGQATAIGALVTGSWAFAPSWQLNVRAGGQVAFQPLTTPMQFTLGSDVGLRGLPGQLISGDNGWLATGEVSWTFWQKGNQALQLVPFIGAGGVRTDLPDVSFSETVGSGGVLARWLYGTSWEVEVGWVEQFSSNDNLGAWTDDWALGQGFYGKIQYSF
jgi:hemolysin activation/secretion protein